MIQNDFGQISIANERLGWEARHDEGHFGGPDELLVDGEPVARVVTFYIDDMDQEAVAVDRTRAFRKGGAGIVQQTGTLPFGHPIQVGQTCRYAANHVRVTFDINWPNGAPVDRHLGVGCLDLPGRWVRYYAVPPCAHLAEGAGPAWHDIPADPPGSGMLGHWHRPPLALVFEREDGFRLEVGTGSDVWRWEHCFGFGPEAGSYKIMHTGDGLRFLREPLMTCETVLPEKRQYRLNWYLAWQRPGDKAPKVPKGDALDLAAASPADIRANEGGVFRLDPALVGVAEACLRQETSEAFIRGDAPTAPCWQSNGTQKALRKLVRPLIALDTPGTLVVGPLDPAACWVPNHFDRNQQRGLPHWDLCSILDFAVWARQGLGPEWTIVPDSAMAATLPSMAGLLGETGFGKDEDMGE